MAVKRARSAHGSASRGQRPAQRRRTRKAIVDAAMTLIAQGKTPSVADVAAAADVSRRTVYLYFPTSNNCSWTRRSVRCRRRPSIAQ